MDRIEDIKRRHNLELPGITQDIKYLIDEIEKLQGLVNFKNECHRAQVRKIEGLQSKLDKAVFQIYKIRDMCRQEANMKVLSFEEDKEFILKELKD